MNKAGLHPVYPTGVHAAGEVIKPYSQANPAKDEWERHTEQGTDKKLETARANATHYQKEAERLRFIASDQLEEAKRFKQDKRGLKTDLEDSRKELDTWKQRYNEMASSQKETQIHHMLATKEAKDLQKRLDKTQKTLVEHQQRLKTADEERPEVVEKLQMGGLAFRQVKAMKATVAEAKRENATLMTRIRELELRNASIEEKLRTAEAIKSVRPSSDHSELVATKDRLKSSAMEVATLTRKMQGCATMLVKTEQVLVACSELHVGKDGSQALATALKETSATVAEFLASLKAPPG